ncbi:uncharacterized protein LOC62_07G008822 [Vanrija pseudolonga]|uniref:Uncharacterized protein n=1 Tax=Vanrija pseudolonga TaxID=143232 RepID=A0AAF0YIV2_9TREE|nr:hypothetical protein LOC62_07G008822 [Vanrija pseudolonga]
MSITDPNSKVEAPPPRPFIDPTAYPHIYQQILEDPAVYWELHDLRVVSRAFADMIDGIQCTHLVIQMTEPGTITRKSYWDEVKMLEAHGDVIRLRGEESCVDMATSEEYLVQRRITLDDITCAIRGRHIPVLWALWEDEWDSGRRQRALGLVRRNTSTVEFGIHRPPEPWAAYQFRYVGPDAVFAPDGCLRQVVHALSDSVREVRGDRNWVVDTITPRPGSRGSNLAEYIRQRLPHTAMIIHAVNGFWRAGEWENRPPMFTRALDLSVKYTFHIHYTEPDNKVNNPGMLDTLIETMAQGLWAPWTVVIADQGVPDQAWIGRHPPRLAPVYWRLQEAVLDWVRDVGQRTSPQHFGYSPYVFMARVRSILVISPDEYEQQASSRVHKEVDEVHHWWPVSIRERHEIEKGKCRREFDRRRRQREEAAAKVFASME